VSTATQPRQPIAGPMFRQVAALRIEGTKRRKMLALLAAYTDGGRPAPPVQELADRLGFRLPTTLGLLRRLEQDGFLIATKGGRGRRGRVRYRLRLPDEQPAVSSAHGPDTQPAQRPNAKPSLTGHNGTHPTRDTSGPTLTRDETP
jgi:hypothetical protein